MSRPLLLVRFGRNLASGSQTRIRGEHGSPGTGGRSFLIVSGNRGHHWGEPAIHDLQDLAYQLRSRNLPVHLETCGAFPISGEIDWITISPKWAAPPIEETLEFADELKIIVEDEHSIAKWSEKLSLPDFNIPVWLNPEWSKSKDPVVLESINQWVKERSSLSGGFSGSQAFLSRPRGRTVQTRCEPQSFARMTPIGYPLLRHVRKIFLNQPSERSPQPEVRSSSGTHDSAL